MSRRVMRSLEHASAAHGAARSQPTLLGRGYRRAMEWLYVACIAISAASLVAITLVIPLGVFMRYAMASPLSWPEPAAVTLMVMFSFLGGAAVYRANVHIAVQALMDTVGPRLRRAMSWGVDVCMAATLLFMLV